MNRNNIHQINIFANRNNIHEKKLWGIGIGIYLWPKYQWIDSWGIYSQTIHKLFANRELFSEHWMSFVLSSQSFLSWLVINCMQHFMVPSDASEATLRHWGNIYKLYRLYTFLRDGHYFVLYVLNGKATLWHKLHKLCSFLAVNQKLFPEAAAPAKPCLRECKAVIWLAMYFCQVTVGSVWSCSVLQQS